MLLGTIAHGTADARAQVIAWLGEVAISLPADRVGRLRRIDFFPVCLCIHGSTQLFKSLQLIPLMKAVMGAPLSREGQQTGRLIEAKRLLRSLRVSLSDRG